MKKYFAKSVAALVLAASSFTLTSCDGAGILGDLLGDGDLIGTLTGLLGNLFGGKEGDSYVYLAESGEAFYATIPSAAGYVPQTSNVSLSGLNVRVTDCSSTANLTLSAMTLEGYSVSELKFTGLSMKQANVEGGSYIQLDVTDNSDGNGPNSYGDGSITVDGKNYEVTGVVMENAYVSAADFGIGYMQIFFGDDKLVVIENITGKLAQK